MTHQPNLDFAQLLDWVEGRLSPEQAQAVTQQLAQVDEHTLATVTWLRAFQHASAALVIETAPASLHSSLIERFAAIHHKPGMLQRIVALLSFDSTQQPALLGARGTSTGKRRQLVFNSEVADIAINILPRVADQQLELSGQIFKKNTDLGELLQVSLMRDENLITTVSVDELGEFSFPAVSPATYTISIHDTATELVCGPLTIEG